MPTPAAKDKPTTAPDGSSTVIGTPTGELGSEDDGRGDSEAAGVWVLDGWTPESVTAGREGLAECGAAFGVAGGVGADLVGSPPLPPSLWSRCDDGRLVGLVGICPADLSVYVISTRRFRARADALSFASGRRSSTTG
ncbi:hypothetical protein GCM10022214_78220 [Actinomadura miaoliensis]|uniref:GNAT family N-acetyltransferase n=1 Tax=Actinomadura miaoliensis TaxID=430685 RepID=A0ABP7WZU8_9ACTN